MAAEMGCDQATVSRQIAALERWLGRRLVSGAAPVRLTEDGERFATVAADVLARLQSFRADRSKVQPPSPKISGKDIVI